MLRRSWCVVAAALFVASLAVPQASAQGIKLGVKGGVNIGDIGGSDVDLLETDLGASKKTKVGLVAGAFAEFMIGDMFGIQPEVLYSQKGAKFEDAGLEGKLKLDYIEVPVLFKVNVPIEGSNVHPSFFVGPAVAFKASCKLEDPAAGTTEDCEAGGALVKSTDFGVAFGGGISFDVGGAEVGVDVRYTLGLTKIDDDPDPYDIKNKAISIMGTVGFSPNK